MIDRRSIADEVEKLRRNKGLHKGALAKDAGVPDHDVIASIEEASEDIEVETIDRVLKALGSSKLAKDFINSDVGTLSNQSKFNLNPYKGLRSYEIVDTDVFFGRDTFVRQAFAALSENNILFVAGPSGVGKSSAVKAGLLPVLADEENVTIVGLRPGPRPMDSLAAALVKSFPNSKSSDVGVVSAELKKDARLYFFDLQAQPGISRRIVIAIDQFEEVFSPRCDPQQARDFSETLHNLSNGMNPSEWALKIVLTLRADFYPHLVNNQTLNAIVNGEKLISLARMNDEELREAIARPAQIAQRKISKQLQDLIIDDVKSDRGSLPLMAFCLYKIWEMDQRTTIGVPTYRQYGGLKGAISKQAESLYQSESELGKIAIKRLFSRLVTVAPDTGTEIRMRSKVLEAALVPEGINTALVDRLIDARLLTADFDDNSQSKTIELAHEAIIYGWERLNAWLEEDRELIRWKQEVEVLQERWQREDRSVETLLAGDLLKQGKAWIHNRKTDIDRSILEYVELSIQNDEHKRVIEAAAKIELILEADASRLADRIHEAKYLGFLEPKYLRSEISKRKTDTEIWKLQLASLTYDPGAVRHILPRLDACEPSELVPICTFLKPIYEELIATGGLSTTDPKTRDDVFLRRVAACLLMSPTTEEVEFNADRVAYILAHENPLMVRDFVLAMRSARARLFDPLLRIIEDMKEVAAVRDTAALLILDFFEDSAEEIAAVLGSASIQVYNVALGRLFDESRRASELVSALKLKLQDACNQNGFDGNFQLSQSAARMSATLARLGQIDEANKVLRLSGCTDVKSQYCAQLKRIKVDQHEIVESFVAEQDSESIYWLGIAIGEFELSDFEGMTKRSLLNCLEERYEHHQSAGVHGICGWLMDHFGCVRKRIDIDKRTISSHLDADRQWINLQTPVGVQRFVLIEGGEYIRGSHETEDGFASYEGPQQLTTVKNKLAVATLGVTVGDFRKFCDTETNFKMPLNIAPFSPDDDHPIISITWNEATSYCQWWQNEMFDQQYGLLSALRRKPMVRLPYEHEWEYFCRAGTQTPYSFGTDVDLLTRFAWYQENSGFKTQPFGKLRPNPWGLFDVHGNCWEWCYNPYELYQGSDEVETWEGTEDLRPLKGGGWNLHHRYCRSACRNWHNAGNRNYYTGMRLVIELK